MSSTNPFAHHPQLQTSEGSLDYQQVYADLKPWEGFCKYMYLDTATPPKVTVGVGNMLPDVASAQALPFINASANRPATKEEIAAAYNTVASMKGSLPADKYQQNPSIEITEEQAKTWAISRLKNEFVKKLRHTFKGFDQFPLPAKEALIDMIYNMGIGWGRHVVNGKTVKARGLLSYKGLVRAVEARDWKTAAQHCWRTPSNKKHPQHAEARNAWTKKRFEDADRLAHLGQIGSPDGGQK